MKKESRRAHNPVRGSTEEALQKAGTLAPLEERASKHTHGSSSNDGAIEVNTAELKVPKDLTEAEDQPSRFLGLEPVAFVILVVGLAFIAYITYLIYIEPVKDKDQPNTTIENQR